jgi:D-alanine-D-alanine ligase
MKVAVLHGAVPDGANKDELDALVEAEAVSKGLLHLGHEPLCVPLSLDLEAAADLLRALAPSIVFNLVESVQGKGSLIHLAPALLELLGIPYTGARTEAMFLTSNKVLAKHLMMAHGIPTPPWYVVGGKGQGQTCPPGLYIVKSVWEHASIGLKEDSVFWVAEQRELRRELETRAEGLGGECFAELYVEGREFNLSLLASEEGVELLPPAEIVFDAYPEGKRRLVCYRAKWDEGSFEYQHTPRRFHLQGDDPLIRSMEGMARACWDLFGLRGYARVDFRVDREGRPWVLEVNANPCLSPDAGFMAAAMEAALGYEEVIDRIMGDSLRVRS